MKRLALIAILSLASCAHQYTAWNPPPLTAEQLAAIDAADKEQKAEIAKIMADNKFRESYYLCSGEKFAWPGCDVIKQHWDDERAAEQKAWDDKQKAAIIAERNQIEAEAAVIRGQ